MLSIWKGYEWLLQRTSVKDETRRGKIPRLLLRELAILHVHTQNVLRVCN